MTISSENVDSTAVVNVSRVAITSGRAGRNESKGVGRLLGGGASVGSTELETSLGTSSHCLVICVKTLISVLDEERLLHGDTGGRCEAIFLGVTLNHGFLGVQFHLFRRASMLELHQGATKFESSSASVRARRCLQAG